MFQNLTGSQLVKNFPALFGTKMFLTALTKAQHVSILNTIA